eukprot:CAMPEP_0181367498 /NCGR_PEP_ID=MMETSP1106-20121128/11448_1 /TAXON_ID=81844 /ORGANISM="Mantoniella antarctica, Strain SL-175" /LENGTH=35 /DNA_ID= /DNA_START= /DNA_END= /DNA_ORIENTATION=
MTWEGAKENPLVAKKVAAGKKAKKAEAESGSDSDG